MVIKVKTSQRTVLFVEMWAYAIMFYISAELSLAKGHSPEKCHGPCTSLPSSSFGHLEGAFFPRHPSSSSFLIQTQHCQLNPTNCALPANSRCLRDLDCVVITKPFVCLAPFSPVLNWLWKWLVYLAASWLP